VVDCGYISLDDIIPFSLSRAYFVDNYYNFFENLIKWQFSRTSTIKKGLRYNFARTRPIHLEREFCPLSNGMRKLKIEGFGGDHIT